MVIVMHLPDNKQQVNITQYGPLRFWLPIYRMYAREPNDRLPPRLDKAELIVQVKLLASGIISKELQLQKDATIENMIDNKLVTL